jgi:hypothetical protein
VSIYQVGRVNLSSWLRQLEKLRGLICRLQKPHLSPRAASSGKLLDTSHKSRLFLENATVRGRAWYKFLDASVEILDVTICAASSGKLLAKSLKSLEWFQFRICV